MPNVKAVPDHCHTLNCYVTLSNCAEAIDWFKKAFNAKEVERMLWPDSGKIMHAQLQIGDSILMVMDEYKDRGSLSAKSLGNTPLTIMMYTENVDQVFDQAVKNGAQVTMPVADMFWGDRYGQLTDPFGNKWAIATHKEDLSREEVQRRQDQFLKQVAHK